jgi:ABC-2 type transport system permease protein
MQAVPISPPSTLMSRLRWALIDGWTITRCNLTHIRYIPEKLLDVTIQPIIFVLLFAYVFGSAIAVPGGGSYQQYLMPGIFVQSIVFGCVSTAVAITELMGKGLIDRFRSLPMARSAVLTGQTVSDLLERTLGLGVMMVCGLITGWRAHENIGQTLAAIGLLLLLSFAMTWVGVCVGLVVRTAETAQVVGFTVIFPMTFVANTFVPTQGMPAWLRTVAEWNPVSATVAACRQLFSGPGPALSSHTWPLQHPIVASLGWSLLILCVAAPLAVRRYRTAIAR